MSEETYELTRSKCPNAAKNLETCMCEKDDCRRRGLCCECVASHKAKGNLPACLR